jgi:hypothetical protein
MRKSFEPLTFASRRFAIREADQKLSLEDESGMRHIALAQDIRFRKTCIAELYLQRLKSHMRCNVNCGNARLF